MIEFAGLLYGLAKDLGTYLSWDEEEKLVDIHWPDASGFKADAEAKGYQLRWCRADRVESRKLEGYEVLYEVDKLKRIRRRLVLRDGLTLMGKQVEADAAT